ncbi:MAG: hypothetical protein OEZ19_00155 [Paracoccaceae bacterium]|nr:hypothetical protein [Paracoccaceae bacterium]
MEELQLLLTRAAAAAVDTLKRGSLCLSLALPKQSPLAQVVLLAQAATKPEQLVEQRL